MFSPLSYATAIEVGPGSPRLQEKVLRKEPIDFGAFDLGLGQICPTGEIMRTEILEEDAAPAENAPHLLGRLERCWQVLEGFQNHGDIRDGNPRRASRLHLLHPNLRPGLAEPPGPEGQMF